MQRFASYKLNENFLKEIPIFKKLSTYIFEFGAEFIKKSLFIVIPYHIAFFKKKKNIETKKKKTPI